MKLRRQWYLFFKAITAKFDWILICPVFRSKSEHETFEARVKNRCLVQEEHLQRLYEEMETQIGQEREKMKKEEERKEARLREELEIALQAKDQQLKEVMSKMSGLKVSNKKNEEDKMVGAITSSSVQMCTK